jgi:CheY-like chemotaxis protein
MPENALAALTQVAAVAAAALVTAMVTDVWREVRERVAGLLSHGDRGREVLSRQLLEESRHRIRSTASGQQAVTRAAEQARWEASLRLALVLDEGLALDLAILADDLAMQLGAPVAPPASMDPCTVTSLHVVRPQRTNARTNARRDFRP